jgi:hypothetical protein
MTSIALALASLSCLFSAVALYRVETMPRVTFAAWGSPMLPFYGFTQSASDCQPLSDFAMTCPINAGALRGALP